MLSSVLISSMIVIFPIILFITHHTHLIMSLLALETIMLTIIFFLTSTASMPMSNSMFISLILLSFSACEASLGLSLLVLMSRLYGSDLSNSLSINKC